MKSSVVHILNAQKNLNRAYISIYIDTARLYPQVLQDYPHVSQDGLTYVGILKYKMQPYWSYFVTHNQLYWKRILLQTIVRKVY